jgi:hypothetical protein
MLQSSCKNDVNLAHGFSIKNKIMRQLEKDKNTQACRSSTPLLHFVTFQTTPTV